MKQSSFVQGCRRQQSFRLWTTRCLRVMVLERLIFNHRHHMTPGGKYGHKTWSFPTHTKLLFTSELRCHWWNVLSKSDHRTRGLNRRQNEFKLWHAAAARSRLHINRAAALSDRVDWQAALGPHPFWNGHSSNPRSHPAADQSWTNMELNREIQAEYKQVMLQMNNTLSIPGSNIQQKQPCFPFTVLGMAICLVSLGHRQRCPTDCLTYTL